METLSCFRAASRCFGIGMRETLSRLGLKVECNLKTKKTGNFFLSPQVSSGFVIRHNWHFSRLCIRCS